ncbi:MAG: hypothetical protein ACLUVZ_08770 [Bacteroides stercoris]
MPLIKKKISELPLADSLKGLYTIGYKIIDGIKTSVKVSLEDIQTAYQDVVNAIKKSEEATSNANNAAVTAEEKATAANTAAQDAEEVANNPTYIGKDHYVYVYNKDTESFDKTDIYCKGEPGSSFRVAGEYATLEALKSAVPDGSAVDGFMAVGTEAPYDYYAWVSSAGGNNPHPSPDGKYLLLSDGTPLLLANEEPILLADNGERVASNGEWVNQGKIGGIDEAPTDGKAYGRKNGNWAEVSDKKYVNDSFSSARSFGYMMGLTEIDASGLDENTWYPVTIATGERMNIRVEVLVSLDSGTKPSWSTHERGFSTRKIWEFAPSVWGVNRDSNITIYLSDFVHADIDPVRGLGNLSQFDTCYVFVRGGGKYHFYASHNAYVTLRTDTYKPSGGTQSVSPTTETPAEIVADIATKKYVKTTHYGKTIVVSNIDKFLYNVSLAGADAEQRTIDLFGNIDNFKNVVADILANHTRYYFHINNNPNNNCIELGCVNAWRANDSTSYELHFIITYFGNNPVKMFTNRISIISNDDNRESKVIIASLVNSDNINTLTKKTSAEYKGIGSKDKETMYAITDV